MLMFMIAMFVAPATGANGHEIDLAKAHTPFSNGRFSKLAHGLCAPA
jgi:hypothetical protein